MRKVFGLAMVIILKLASMVQALESLPSNAWDPSYAATTRLLATWVDLSGMVDYQGLKEHGAELASVLKPYADLAPDSFAQWSIPDQIAFYINAYNLYTLAAIIRAYPIHAKGMNALLYPAVSIRQIPGIWDQPECSILHQKFSLNQIEHEILRPRYQEPRIHLALVCAALSCPPLRNEAYRGGDLEAQFQDQARRFVQDPTKHLILPNRPIALSPIFKWYGSDFIARYGWEEPAQFSPAERAVLHFLRPFETAKNQAWLDSGKFSISYLPYNWSLNESADTQRRQP